jgi:predicted LPLAT superfamily acyltransferase
MSVPSRPATALVATHDFPAVLHIVKALDQAWLRQQERSNVLTLRLMAWIALRLGRPVARLLLVPICSYFVLFSVKARRASQAYLSRVLGRPARLDDVFRHYWAFASVALDRVFLLSGRTELFDIRVYGEDLLQRALETGRGGLLLGAHLGSFELPRAIGRTHSLKVNLLMFEENARKMESLCKAIDPTLANAVIALGRSDSMLRVHECLERGEWLGMLGDRTLQGDAQMEVPFFGSPVPFPTSIFRLAGMLHRPVYLMVGLYRGGNRYELHFERLDDPVRGQRSERDEAAREWLGKYASRLEHYCREAPYNWFNFYDYWSSVN